MKTILKKLLPAVLLVTVLTMSAEAQTRIATIDLRKTFGGYWKTKQADAALKDRAGEMDKEHKALLEEFNKGKEDYQKSLADANDQAVSVEERDKRKKSAEAKLLKLREQEQAIGQFERQARSTLDDQRRRMRENILNEIRAVINSTARTAGYTMVLDSGAESVSNTPVLVFTNGENDITDKILAEINANAPAGALK